MRIKRPRVATLEEVRISRDGECAVIAFRDKSIATTHMVLGEAVNHMTEEEILDVFNEMVRAREQMAAEYEHVAEEVPVGSPQIEYFEPGNQWVPRGDVLRCVVGSGDEDDAVVYIDDQELTAHEFSRLLLTYAGWGMRIIFVPDDEIHQPAKVVVREPTKNG